MHKRILTATAVILLLALSVGLGNAATVILGGVDTTAGLLNSIVNGPHKGLVGLAYDNTYTGTSAKIGSDGVSDYSLYISLVNAGGSPAGWDVTNTATVVVEISTNGTRYWPMHTVSIVGNAVTAIHNTTAPRATFIRARTTAIQNANTYPLIRAIVRP